MILVKRFNFFHILCLSIFDLLYTKQAFLDNENIHFKNPKIGIFPKGLVHSLGQKLEILLTFRFNQITP